MSFPNTSIDRIVPNQNSEDGLSLNVEKYYELVIEKNAFKHNIPAIEGAIFVDNLAPFIERKLFMVNNAHTSTGFYAFFRNFTDMKEALKDEKNRIFLDSILAETEKLLIHQSPELEESIKDYRKETFRRFTEDSQSDSISGICRNPKCKLAHNERVLSPTNQYINAFLETPGHLATSIATGLQYNSEADSESQEIQQLIKNKKLNQAIYEITGIESYTALYKVVVEKVSQLEEDNFEYRKSINKRKYKIKY